MRKRPQQQRSREMVRALIDATGKVIQQQGLDNTTTARIAEVAAKLASSQGPPWTSRWPGAMGTTGTSAKRGTETRRHRW